MVGLFHVVGTTALSKEKSNKVLSFFYAKTSSFAWDPDWWKWLVEGYTILDHSTKFGRNSIINRVLGVSRAAIKWHGYLLGDYKFYWLHNWDPLHSDKEFAFMRSVGMKFVAIFDWRAHIAPISISRQCIFFVFPTLAS